MRHKKVQAREGGEAIGRTTIRRLARRAGVTRISGMIYPEVHKEMKSFLNDVVRNSLLYAEHGKRKTVMTMDVLYALKRQGRTLYGYSG